MSSKGLTPVNLEGFPGLDLRDDPEETGAAIDLQNVELDRPGRVRSRDGFSLKYTSSILGFQPFKLLPYYGKTQLMMLVGAKAIALDNAFALVASQNLSTTGVGDAVAFGTATEQDVFIADRNATGLRKWDGTTFTVVAASPAAGVVGVQKPDNRLVVGLLGGAGTDVQHKVQFSVPGDPTTWNANDYVMLSPSDGEFVEAIVSWRDSLFVFKQTKFFFFYGNSTDSTGNAIFNYRAIETGVGCVDPRHAVAGREGVYFLDRTGIYLTTGGPPVRISVPLDPFFAGVATAFAGGATADLFTRYAALSYVTGRLFAHVYCTDGLRRTLVYDPLLKAWSSWLTEIAESVEYATPSVTNARGVFTGAIATTGSNPVKVFTLDPSVSADDGVAFSSWYQSGFTDMKRPGMEKTVRQTELVGKGTVSFSYARDLAASVTASSTANVVLGTAPATGRGLHRNAACGELLSYKVASTSGPWLVNRVEPMLRETRPAGAMTV